MAESRSHSDSETRAGTVALAGLPNAGKSSLLNAMLDQKLSIVSPAPQTTRERVVGIDTRDGAQLIFLDTPGIADERLLLHRSMSGSVTAAVGEADVVVLVADASHPRQVPPNSFFEGVPANAQLIAALNKIDVASPEQFAAAKARLPDRVSCAVAVSARTGAGIAELRQQIAARLPLSPFLYPADDLATQSTRFFVAELIREAALELYSEEIPHSLAIKVDEFREEREPVYIRATIYTERASQKGVLLGSGGTAIKRLGKEARAKIEKFLGARVYLDLWVKVLPRWRKDALSLQRLGFVLPPSRES